MKFIKSILCLYGMIPYNKFQINHMKHIANNNVSNLFDNYNVTLSNNNYYNDNYNKTLFNSETNNNNYRISDLIDIQTIVQIVLLILSLY